MQDHTTNPLRLAFMGTPDFAVPILQALAKAGHHVVTAYTQPPRPAGRGHRPRPSPVHCVAESAGVAAYGLILPRPVLEAPRLGCLNVHASLLPRWRGAAPIQRAILAGDRETGVT